MIRFVRFPAPAGKPTAIFIHGAGGDHTLWGEQMAALRGRYGVLSADLPGHGLTPRTQDLSIPGYARAVSELAGKLGLTRPVLVGHSMGGAVSLRLALDEADSFGGIVLIGSGAKLGVSPRILDNLERDPEGAIREITAFAYGPGAPIDMVERGRRSLESCPRDVLLADLRACNLFDERARATEIRLPTLVICGQEDRLTFPKYAEWLANAIPGACLLLVPGAGHLVMIERAESVSGAILGFLDRLDSRAVSTGGAAE